MWAVPEAEDISQSTGVPYEKSNLVSDGCDPKLVSVCVVTLTNYTMHLCHKHDACCVFVQIILVYWLKKLFSFYQKDERGEFKDAFRKVSRTADATQ